MPAKKKKEKGEQGQALRLAQYWCMAKPGWLMFFNFKFIFFFPYAALQQRYSEVALLL
jgi:hypothetical protein